MLTCPALPSTFGTCCVHRGGGGGEAVLRRGPGGSRLGRPLDAGRLLAREGVPRLPSPGHYEPGAVGLLGPSLSEHGFGPRLGTEGSPEERVEPAGRSRGSGIKNRAGRRNAGILLT